MIRLLLHYPGNRKREIVPVKKKWSAASSQKISAKVSMIERIEKCGRELRNKAIGKYKQSQLQAAGSLKINTIFLAVMPVALAIFFHGSAGTDCYH